MTLFSNDPDEVDLDSPQIEEGKDYVAVLVGEGKKFKDLNALAASNMHKDTFIQKLIAEKRALEAEVTQRQSVEDIFNKLQKREPTGGNLPPENRQESGTGPTKEEIERIVLDALGTKTKEQTEAANLQIVQTTLSEVFGQNFQTEARKRVKELGLGEDFAASIAKSNPTAFLKLVGADTPVSKDLTVPPRTQVTGPIKAPSHEKTYSYYENIRKTDPARYRTLQSEMFQQAKKLGDAFYN